VARFEIGHGDWIERLPITQEAQVATPNPLIGLPRAQAMTVHSIPSQLTKLAQLAGDMADADRAMMRWAFGVPGIHECSRSHRETVAAVGSYHISRIGPGSEMASAITHLSFR